MKPLALVLVSCSVFAFADSKPKDPKAKPDQVDIAKFSEELVGGLSSVLDNMGPLASKVAEAEIQATLRLAAKPETAKSLAAFKRNLYDALVQDGFSKDEALQIVLATPLPTHSTGK